MLEGGILALDVATTTGWAYAGPDALRDWPRMPLAARQRTAWPGVRSGSKGLGSGRTHGALYVEMVRWLDGMLTLLRPGLVVVEAPLPRPAKGADAARRSIGLVSMVDAACAGLRVGTNAGTWIEAREVAVSSVKLSFAGSGRADKDGMVAECFARGFRPADDNEADALALLDHAAVGLWSRWQRAA